MPFVVRARRVHCSSPDVAVDRTLVAHVRREEAVPPLFIYSMRILAGDRELLRGLLPE